jgi:hypothetical protein
MEFKPIVTILNGVSSAYLRPHRQMPGHGFDTKLARHEAEDGNGYISPKGFN